MNLQGFWNAISIFQNIRFYQGHSQHFEDRKSRSENVCLQSQNGVEFCKKVIQTSVLAMNLQGFWNAISIFQNIRFYQGHSQHFEDRKSRSENVCLQSQNGVEFCKKVIQTSVLAMNLQGFWKAISGLQNT